jgi:AraC family transcriptional regulator, ethanolamine operon transcriptional activator
MRWTTMTRSANPISEPCATGPPLTRFLSLRTTDFDEIAAGFPGWDQRYIQIGGGPFRGRAVLAQVGCFQFFEAEGNRAMLARGGSPPNSYAFSPVQERNAGAVWRGRVLRREMINIRRPGEPMDHRTSEDYRTTGLIVDAEFVHRVTASLHGVDVESILRGPVATIDPQRCVSLDRSLRSALARLAPGHDAEATAPQVQEFLIDWLSAVLGDLLPERWRESPSLGLQRRAQVVREAEDYMSTYLDRPMTLLEICEAVGVSERTLIYAFRERLGLSPKAYLKSLKLNRLRQDLKAADPDTQSVHQIARLWGFDHSGALAADYRRLFGELPRQTLQRRKR